MKILGKPRNGESGNAVIYYGFVTVRLMLSSIEGWKQIEVTIMPSGI